ncbi:MULTISPECIES: type 2 periplasmic-binding domain-containing protein [Oceanimonas]|uniref:Uncharacterized protein n=1 Tax=Oceanimonas smirnovii TaxID=264574 RepID=A0ABW7NXW3_9GAMM
MPGKVVATINDTASQRYLEDERIRYQTYPNLTAAMESVLNGETAALCCNTAICSWASKN